ncbi:MAG TPA: tRNA (adenosine(37)-N6)-threonylcarbamoyltransferase complex dimerization subunit type 1 TsaB [Methylotenera sp.]|nr:tRNA (adenosine(37)-N6)-threonylcarbamoyltransferase complex dimerization subunit type 1 TsaB [Methylotenera sp.]HPV44537.1 tRNA (adenosine(37)-N6)-threonylcarbamoyltransferase complex dimerization subunit type 1 TsaB [Methylotenera sp.]
MKILALDTSTEFLSLALQVGDKSFSHYQNVGQTASQLILPRIQVLLDEAEIKLSDLDGIAFGAGPGSFTGVRIACGVAQGLGFGANLPVAGINTLMAAAEASGKDRVIACLDARMGEIYHAAYVKQNGAWHEVSATTVCKPEAAPALDGGDWVGVGSGWAAYGEVLSRIYAKNLSQILPDITPTAEAILQLGLPALAAGNAKPASEAAPIYIRNRVALTTRERELGQRL